MRKPFERRLAFHIIFTVAALTQVACDGAVPPTRVGSAPPAVRSVAPNRAREEFHRRNSMDFIGAMQTEFMQQTTARMRATKRVPRTQDLCANAIAFWKSQKRPEWLALPAQLRNLAVGAMPATCEKIMPRSKGDSRVHVAGLFPEEYNPDYDVSSDFWNGVGQMDQQFGAATDLNDLASRYTAILNSTTGMRWPDSVGVEVMLSLAMSQAEYMWDGSVLDEYINQADAAWSSCEEGLIQAITIEIGPGQALECEDHQMVSVVRGPAAAAGRAQFRNASYSASDLQLRAYLATAPTPLPDCNATKRQRVWRAFSFSMAAGGVGYTAGAILGAIGGAATGGVPGAIAGAKSGGGTLGAIGVIVGGLGATIYQAGDYVYCLRRN